jgi:hypothetical protein
VIAVRWIRVGSSGMAIKVSCYLTQISGHERVWRAPEVPATA